MHPQAMRLLAEMRDTGVVPDVTTYTTAVNACVGGGGGGGGGNVRAARKLLRDMRYTPPGCISAGTDDASVDGAGTGTTDTTSLTRAEARRAAASAAVQPNVVTYNSALNVCAAAGDPAFALELLADMEQQVGAM
jgi:pentatricopeptide repeat protein